MRAYTFLAALATAFLLAVSLGSPVAAENPLPKVSWHISATSHDGEPLFEVNTIIVPTVPSIVNITVTNDDPDPGFGALHTFTIRSEESSDPLVDLLLRPGDVLSVEFLLAGPTQIEINGRNETTQSENGALYFVCRPHEGAGMTGTIVVGGLQEEEPEPVEKGVFLRAYWIGLLGMAGTLLVIVVSYFVIKGSSRHFRDHRDHLRRGGP